MRAVLVTGLLLCLDVDAASAPDDLDMTLESLAPERLFRGFVEQTMVTDALFANSEVNSRMAMLILPGAALGKIPPESAVGLAKENGAFFAVSAHANKRLKEQWGAGYQRSKRGARGSIDTKRELAVLAAIDTRM